MSGCDQGVRQLHRGEIPPEDPVEERRVVVAVLIGPSVAQVVAIGDLEQRALVCPADVLLDQRAAFLQDAGEGNDRRPLALILLAKLGPDGVAGFGVV